MVKEQPKQAVFVQAVLDYDFTKRPGKLLKKKAQEQQVTFSFKKVHTSYFSEEISEVETLRDGSHTVICLQTKIYVFSANGRVISDIIACCNPRIYAATTKSLSNHVVIASLFSQSVADYKEDSVQIRDYSSTPFCA